jgi:acetoin:2,6-dichlorophenolindophenol oxidoreductase subunit alpha
MTEENAYAAAVSPNGDFLRTTFRAMLRARILENKLSSLYKAGKIVGGVCLGRGQEAVSATLGASLIQGKDCYAPLIRDQAGRTAFGEPLIDCTRTYLGSVEGPMKGRDGNIHRGRPEMGMPAMISHLGAQVPLIAGMLFAKRLKGTLDGCVGATSVGDGATSTGAFHEGLNMAAVEKLPMVVVVANNQFAYSTPNNRQFACADLVERAAGYGIGGFSLDGTDFLECASVVSMMTAHTCRIPRSTGTMEGTVSRSRCVSLWSVVTQRWRKSWLGRKILRRRCKGRWLKRNRNPCPTHTLRTGRPYQPVSPSTRSERSDLH